MAFLHKADWIERYKTPANADRMAYINFSCLVSSSVLFAYLYARSVSPVQFKKHYGEKVSFKYATYLRQGCFAIMFMSFYHFWKYPSNRLKKVETKLGIPSKFSFSTQTRNILSWLIAIPATIIELWGLYEAGYESLRPSKDTKMYGGIYNYIRHPQAVGEFPFWWIAALYLDSPAMFAFSTVFYLPVWYWWCKVEEKDLLLKYGDTYKEYMTKTGFWFPKLSH
eukprot:431408_1